VFTALAHENPLIARFQRTGDGRPYRISDVMDQETFRGLALYKQVYRLIGVECQVAFTLPSTPILIVGLVLCREREDFTNRETQLLALARPHLIQAYRNAQLSGARTAMLAALQEGLDTIGRHVIVLDQQGRVEFASRQTRRMLGEGALMRLPGTVRAWLAGRRPTSSASQPLAVRGREGRVLVRTLPSSREDRRLVLLCEADDGAVSAGALRTLGLTGRQAEVLSWLARGYTTAEAAERMGIARRTADKHLQHVYAALGVGDRVQAVATAWAAVGLEQTG
jgi:DNA-binding CsgD family transcriptional regulator